MSEVKIIYLNTQEMPPAAVGEVLGRLAPTDPVVLALHALVQRRVIAAQIAAADPALTERAAGHAGGRLEELMLLWQEVMAQIQAPKERARRG